jgi:dihydrolipoamide dehydrogenase
MVMGSLREETEVAVIGGGPGGYVAAIRAADLGREVTLIEEREGPGGVCLVEGCIPSKTLIHAVQLLDAAREARRIGIVFPEPTIDHRALRQWTETVVSGLVRGVEGLLARRGVNVVRGRARFEAPGSLSIEGSDLSGVDYRHCIIATGSRINEIPLAYDLPVWSSADALKLPSIPASLLVVGGGYIGLEMGTVYAGLGSRVTMVELFPRLLPGADPDLVRVVVRQAEKRFESVQVESKVVGMERTGSGFAVTVEHGGETRTTEYEQVLVAVGRRPNTDDLGLDKTAIRVDERGVIQVDEGLRTAEPGVYAIGDVAPGPMLAHKASREGKVAAEVISGRPSAFDNRAVPAVVYTDPEISWTGLTEREAAAAGRSVTVGRFPLSALGRARTLGRSDGFVKVLSDPGSGLILGAAMVGPSASELIAEATLAIEMGATLEDLLVTIHPHPTMSEAMMEAADVAAGMPIHIAPPGGG